MLNMRIADTLSAIEKHWFLSSAGQIYVKQIQFRLRSLSVVQMNQIDAALSLGARAGAADQRPKFSMPLLRTPTADGMTDKRQAIRACMLAEMAIKNRPPDPIGSLVDRLNALNMDQLIKYFTTCFPLVADFGDRATWEHGFTHPNRHNPSRFQYIVHAIRVDQGLNPGANVQLVSGDTLLANPDLVQTWSAISCSVVDQSHSRTYHGCGLILRVPAQNILVTSHGDVGFRNHAGLRYPEGATPQRRLEVQASFAEEIRSQNHQHGLQSPNAILARTGTIEPYNEIVVAGTSSGPLFVSRVYTLGFFVQRSAYVGQLGQKLDNAAAALNKPLVIL